MAYNATYADFRSIALLSFCSMGCIIYCCLTKNKPLKLHDEKTQLLVRQSILILQNKCCKYFSSGLAHLSTVDLPSTSSLPLHLHSRLSKGLNSPRPI